MNRVLMGSVVDETNHRLGAAGDDQSGARRHPVVANKSGGTEVGIDLVTERLDLQLIVPDLLPGDGTDDFPILKLDASREQRSVNCTNLVGSLTGGIGRATL